MFLLTLSVMAAWATPTGFCDSTRFRHRRRTRSREILCAPGGQRSCEHEHGCGDASHRDTGPDHSVGPSQRHNDAGARQPTRPTVLCHARQSMAKRSAIQLGGPNWIL
eukprot:SAG25_NODE_5_length_29351_cov_43.404335_34_plen_108_part_00